MNFSRIFKNIKPNYSITSGSKTNLYIIKTMITQLSELKLSKLKNLVYRLTDTVNTKALQQWLNKRKRCLDLKAITIFTKKRLPNLRYKFNWQQIAKAIIKMMEQIRSINLNLDLWIIEQKTEPKNKNKKTTSRRMNKRTKKSTSKIKNNSQTKSKLKHKYEEQRIFFTKIQQ